MNHLKCKECKNYDVIRSGKSKTPTHGWCAVKSLYPFTPGPTDPPNVRRVAEGALPKPEIVEGNVVLRDCGKAAPK